MTTAAHKHVYFRFGPNAGKCKTCGAARNAGPSTTTQARRIARFCNKHGEPGFVALFDRDGNWIDWVCGPGGGVSLNDAGRAAGSALYRVGHGRDTARDVQREIDNQYQVSP